MKYLVKGLKVVFILSLLSITIIVFLFGHRDIPLEELKAKYANHSSSFLQLNGMEVHFRDEGNSNDSIPIVLIHGTGSSLHTFDAWTEGLKDSRRVVRMDLPAYGLTGPFPNGNYSIANYTAFIKDFLTALNIEQCILAGNSLGGKIAWNFVSENPDMVKKLILIDAAGYPTHSKSIPIAFELAKIPVFSKLFTFITPRFIAKTSIENVYFDKSKVTDSLVERYFELTLREGNRQAFVERFKIVKDANAHLKIKNIEQPTLILWGAEDYLIPLENAYQFHENLPNDTLVVLNGCGHTPMEESPLESLEPVLTFLKN